MTAKKNLPQRQKELQSLLATPEGRAELTALEARYAAADGRTRVGHSVITYLLVYEREHGLICD